MKTCTRKGCDNQAVYLVASRTHYCVTCTWIISRINRAKTRNKYAPTWDEVKAIMCSECPHCGKTMTYERVRENRKRVATLQHNHDGSVTIICHTCNSGHGNAKLGDAWFDVPEGYKYCSKCETIKTKADFHKNCTMRDGLRGECKPCHIENTTQANRVKRGKRKVHNGNDREAKRQVQGEGAAEGAEASNGDVPYEEAGRALGSSD